LIALLALGACDLTHSRHQWTYQATDVAECLDFDTVYARALERAEARLARDTGAAQRWPEWYLVSEMEQEGWRATCLACDSDA